MGTYHPVARESARDGMHGVEIQGRGMGSLYEPILR
jgi:hypothetical protein